MKVNKKMLSLVLFFFLINNVYSAWWDTDYSERYAINFSTTHSEITNQNMIQIENIDSSSFVCSGDNNKFAVVWHNSGVETSLDTDILGGVCGTGDINIVFKSQFNIPQNTGLTTTDTNGYYIYVTTNAVPSPDRNQENVYNFFDGLEDGDFLGWTKSEGAGTFSAQTSVVREGLYAVSGGSDTKYYRNATINTDSNVSFWFRFTSAAANGSVMGVSPQDSGAANFGIRINQGGSNKFRVWNGAAYSDFSGTNPNVSADKWYKLIIQKKDATTGDIYLIDDDNKTVLGYKLGVSTAAGYGAISLQADTESGTTYYDSIKSETQILIPPTYTLGSQEQQDQNLSFSDLNLFECGSSFTENLDLNVHSDLNIVFDFNATKGTSDINSDAFEIYYTIQEEGDDLNCVGTIRDQPQCGWKIEDSEDISFTLIQEYGDTNHWRTTCEDDHAFKHWSYNLNPELFETKGTPFLLNATNIWLKTLLTNARDPAQQSDANVLFNFSFSANFIGIQKNLRLYVCNQDIANPISDDVNCNELFISASQQKEKDLYYSFFRTSNDLNQFGINDVNLNSDGNFWLYLNCNNCSATNRWEVDTIDTNSNIDRVRNWSSSSGIENLAAFSRTIDFHIHWQDTKVDHNFVWFVKGSDINNSDVNSSLYIENIENVNLPPSIISIKSPVEGTYVSGNIDVNILVLDPNSGDVIVCDINIIDINEDMNTLAEAVLPVNNICSYDFNTLTFPDGSYRIHVQVRETNTSDLFSSDLNQDQSFIINNFTDTPTIQVVYPNGGEIFNNLLIDTNTITFQIKDTDSNSFLVDINYSTTGSQGGTVIINDINTDSATINCGTTNFFNDVNCTYTWDLNSVPDGNYFIIISVKDTQENSAFDSSDSNFLLFTSAGPEISPIISCSFNIEYSFDLGQYLNIALSGVNSDGNIFTGAKFNLYWKEQKLLNQVSMTRKGNLFTYVFKEKFNNDPFILEILSNNNCIISKIVRNI